MLLAYGDSPREKARPPLNPAPAPVTGFVDAVMRASVAPRRGAAFLPRGFWFGAGPSGPRGSIFPTHTTKFRHRARVGHAVTSEHAAPSRSIASKARSARDDSPIGGRGRCVRPWRQEPHEGREQQKRQDQHLLPRPTPHQSRDESLGIFRSAREISVWAVGVRSCMNQPNHGSCVAGRRFVRPALLQQLSFFHAVAISCMVSSH